MSQQCLKNDKCPPTCPILWTDAKMAAVDKKVHFEALAKLFLRAAHALFLKSDNNKSTEASSDLARLTEQAGL